MNFNRIGKLNNLVSNDLKRKPTIILDPNPEQSYRMFGTANDIVVGIDADDWEVPDELKGFIKEIAGSGISNEEMILKVYQKLCEDYTYDDNVLSYIKKNDDETFYLPDEYGRDPDSIWKENRKKHNRRNCFEISRILAKSISEVLKSSGNSRNYDVCIIWDEAVTHYLVGLACNDYYLSLDLDDFTQIKDLTRMKTGLTLEGIKILDDPSDKFGEVLRNFNKSRGKIAKDYIESKRNESIFSDNESISRDDEDVDSDDINFLKFTAEILNEMDLDSAGIYEFFKEIVDTKIGTRARKKDWKKVENNPGTGNRYTRCLTVKIGNNTYVVDVTKQKPEEIFRKCTDEDLKELIPFKDMERNWNEDPYDGR